jgi:hypothetical protein
VKLREYHPRQWVDGSSLAYKETGRDFVLYLSPLAAGEGREGKLGIPGGLLCRLALNHPPTAVGGIPEVFTRSRDEVGYAQESDAHLSSTVSFTL